MKKYFLLIITFLLILTSCSLESIATEKEQNEPSLKPISNTLPANDELIVHYIDAGQADATLFQFHNEGELMNILYDTGDWKRTDVIDYLTKLNIDTLDLVIISHPHADHIGQLSKIIDTFEVGEVWMSGNQTTTNNFTSAIQAVLEAEIPYDEPRQGMIYDIGPLTLSILHPSELTGGLNEDSLSIKFTYGEVDLLFTGDAYKKQEKMMIAGDIDLSAKVLQLGHHGSNTSSSNEFIDAVNPDVAIYSAGIDNAYNHPSSEVIDRLTKKGITVYGTDLFGSIIFTTDGKSYELNTINKKTNEQTTSCIDVNKASNNELTHIVHIGDARAKEIIENRPYDNLKELKQIKGINHERLTEIKNENLACIGGS